MGQGNAIRRPTASEVDLNPQLCAPVSETAIEEDSARLAVHFRPSVFFRWLEAGLARFAAVSTRSLSSATHLHQKLFEIFVVAIAFP